MGWVYVRRTADHHRLEEGQEHCDGREGHRPIVVAPRTGLGENRSKMRYGQTFKLAMSFAISGCAARSWTKRSSFDLIGSDLQFLKTAYTSAAIRNRSATLIANRLSNRAINTQLRA